MDSIWNKALTQVAEGASDTSFSRCHLFTAFCLSLPHYPSLPWTQLRASATLPRLLVSLSTAPTLLVYSFMNPISTLTLLLSC